MNSMKLFRTMVLVLAMAMLGTLPAWAAGGPAKTPAGSPKPDATKASPPTGVSNDWWGQVQKYIAVEEYQATWPDKAALPDLTGACQAPTGNIGNPDDLSGACQAPNRAHNLRTFFTDAGPRVLRRDVPSPEWIWGLEFVGMQGNGISGPSPELQGVVAKGNRVEYQRGEVTEWYVNSDKGLEQGFTINVPGATGGGEDAAVSRGDGDIVLDLAVRGNLAPGMMPDGGMVEFLSSGGVGIIHYGHLKVNDALGKELCATLKLLPSQNPNSQSLDPARIRISVDAVDAVYPITIDPLATSAAWTAESNQNGAEFGYSVSTAGDVNGDGYADVIVGAPWYDNGQTDEGRVYVYLGSASGLSATADWTAESDQANAEFGYSVSTAGDVNGDGYPDVIVSALH